MSGMGYIRRARRDGGRRGGRQDERHDRGTSVPIPHQATLAAITVVAALALGGCSGDDKGSSADPPSATPTPSASTTPPSDAAPTLPPEARGHSEQAAIAFTKYAVDVLNYSGQTLDVRPIRAIASNDCAACRGIIATLLRIKKAGGSVRGGIWRPDEVVVLHSAEPGYQVQALIRFDAQVVHQAAHSKATRFNPGRALYRFAVHRSGGHLRLADLEEVS